MANRDHQSTPVTADTVGRCAVGAPVTQSAVDDYAATTGAPLPVTPLTSSERASVASLNSKK